MTKLNKWFDMVNVGDSHSTYTRDSWMIPEGGSTIWCTGWEKERTIKPYGDGCHVVVGTSVYHCDELMGVMERWERDGHTWGIRGVTATREQQIRGHWRPVPIMG